MNGGAPREISVENGSLEGSRHEDDLEITKKGKKIK